MVEPRRVKSKEKPNSEEERLGEECLTDPEEIFVYATTKEAPPDLTALGTVKAPRTQSGVLPITHQRPAQNTTPETH